MSLAGADAARRVEPVEPDIDEVIDGRAISAVFMPIVRLDTYSIVGFEALARGPFATALEPPRALFAAAAAAGRAAELDWVCRAAAYRAALEAKMPPSVSLFVNSDPRRLAASCPADLAQGVWRAESKLRVVAEVSEGTIAGAPAELSAAMERVRRVGWGVAVDNVGTEPRALPMLSVVQPDVIKVDVAALDRGDERMASIVVNAVLAEAERTGATILAESIETKRHLALARAIGADVGQGFLFGQPGPLPDRLAAVPRPVRFMEPSKAAGRSPYEIVARSTRARMGSAAALEALRRHVLAAVAGPTVVASSWSDPGAGDPGAGDAGSGDQGSSGPGSSGPGSSGPGSSGPSGTHRDLVVVGPHFAAALVAHDRDEAMDSSDHRFEFCLTYERDLVLEAARALFERADDGLPVETELR